MTGLRAALLGTAFALGAVISAQALPAVGTSAPDFTAVDSNGESVSLGDFAGKLVVLEWTNSECPYVRKHYDSGNMQGVQEAVTEAGGVWLSVISSAPGKQGYVTADEANAIAEDEAASATHILLDPEGTLGHLYGASATPHMFVIDADQTLRYMGAIDDKPSASPATLDGATNYVTAAVSAIAAGDEVAVAETAAYGCSVKY